MAKKTSKAKVGPGLFDRTKPAPASADDTDDTKEPGRTVAMSVALQNAELDILQKIADSAHVKRGNVLSYAVRYFMREYQTGSIRLKRGARNLLELPEGYDLPAEPLER
jgi:hypothetical protein